MRVSVIGAGYVGLVTGVCLAKKGHKVACVDQDAKRVELINKGFAPICEQGLEALLRETLGDRFQATTDLVSAVTESELTLVCVGTPSGASGPDLGQLKAASLSIGKVLRHKSSRHVVVVKSTVIPGTTDEIVRPILEDSSGKIAGPGFGLGANPEFLREGLAVDDFMTPDRIIAGGVDSLTHDAIQELYAPFGAAPFVRTNNKTAEMIKCASNALLATLISFSNEIGNLGAAIGDIDAQDVMRGIHLDKRFSISDGERRYLPGIVSYLEAGCGFGGSCLPKDVRALIFKGGEIDVSTRVLSSVAAVNDGQPYEVVQRILRHYPSLYRVKVCVLGLAFKPGTDDMRESPAIAVIRSLASFGAFIAAYDPAAMENASKILMDVPIDYKSSLQDAVSDAEVVVVLTKWPEFGSLPDVLQSSGSQPLVVDGRRMFQKKSIQRYEGLGA